MDPPRPALDTLFDAARAYVARGCGPSTVPVEITIRLSSGATLTVTASAMFAPLAEDEPPARNRNVSDECLAEIVDLLAEVGERMTGEEVVKALERTGRGRNETAVKRTLAHFTRAGQLSHDGKAKPPGYGLPEW